MATTRTSVKSSGMRGTVPPLIMLSCPVTSARIRTMASVSAAAAAGAAAAATTDYNVGYYVPSMAYYDIPALTPAPAAALAPAATSSGTPSASSVEE